MLLIDPATLSVSLLLPLKNRFYYRTPVVTPNGYIFDRESILEYILAQKKAIAKKTKEWEKQCQQEQEETKKVFLPILILLNKILV